MTAKIKYSGDLRTESTHIGSGATISTDAPVDNNGKGQLFSPTDLVASSLVSCMLTIAGISANAHNFSLEGAEGSVKKIMGTNPRRISALEVELHFPQQYSDKEKKLIKAACLGCPVKESLHPDLELKCTFNFG